MGTRADFYMGRGVEAEWLGSIAWDGYPSGVGVELLHARDAQQFRDRVDEMGERGDFTRPADGWPWPWEDSNTTDYAYAFDAGEVWMSCFGHGWARAAEPEPEDWPEEKTSVFPNMKARTRLALGTPRDSMMILTAKSKPEDFE